MKFNPDCVKSILLTVEEKSDGRRFVNFPDDFPFDKFSENECEYHIRQCKEAKLLIVKSETLSGSFAILDLTNKGHTVLSEMQKPKFAKLIKQAIPTCEALISLLLNFYEK